MPVRKDRTVPEAVTGAKKRRPARNTEHQAVVKACRDYIGALGGWSYKLLGSLGQASLPDVAAILHGRSIWIEVKTGKAQLTAGQEAVAHDIMGAGGLFVVVRCIEDLEAALIAAGVVEGPYLNR